MKSCTEIGLMKVFFRGLILVATMTLLTNPAQAQLNVMISGGFSGAYRQMLPEFEKANNIKVTTGSGASQGTGPLTIAAQLQRGVPADLVILSREGLDELTTAGKIVPGSDVDLASVPLGIAVRSGSPKPDVSTVSALKRTLINAKTIAVPGSTSGIYLTTQVFPKLGVADQISVTVTERGSQSAGMVAKGEANMAIQPVSELVNVPGIDYEGRLPDEFQLIQVFAAAIVKNSKEPESARKLIAFLASEQSASAIQSSGMDLIRKPK